MSCSSNCKSENVKYSDYFSNELYTWCTNCGNYGIHAALKRALVAECIAPKDALLCFDIGCNGNGSDKIAAYAVHGLHGRIISFAAGACVANRNVKVVAFGGDGGTLSEGIGHFVHSIRSNYPMVFVLHNNKNYGLTTGQASSTTPQDVPMHASPDGVTADTLEPMHLALSLGVGFAARSFSGDVEHMTSVFRSALNYRGFAFVEILQDCPTYNKATPHEWYMQRVYDVSTRESYSHSDISSALAIASNMEHIPIGVIYKDDAKQDFLARQKNREGITSQLVDEVRNIDISPLLESLR